MEGRNDTYVMYTACVYTARLKGGMAHVQRPLPMYTQHDGREEWHMYSVRCLYIHSMMEGRNGTCTAYTAYVYTARWKGGMTYTQYDRREEWHMYSVRCLYIHST